MKKQEEPEIIEVPRHFEMDSPLEAEETDVSELKKIKMAFIQLSLFAKNNTTLFTSIITITTLFIPVASKVLSYVYYFGVSSVYHVDITYIYKDSVLMWLSLLIIMLFSIICCGGFYKFAELVWNPQKDKKGIIAIIIIVVTTLSLFSVRKLVNMSALVKSIVEILFTLSYIVSVLFIVGSILFFSFKTPKKRNPKKTNPEKKTVGIIGILIAFSIILSTNLLAVWYYGYSDMEGQRNFDIINYPINVITDGQTENDTTKETDTEHKCAILTINGDNAYIVKCRIDEKNNSLYLYTKEYAYISLEEIHKENDFIQKMYFDKVVPEPNK